MTSKDKLGADQDEDGDEGTSSGVHSRTPLLLIRGWLDRPGAINEDFEEEVFVSDPRNPAIAYKEWRLDGFQTVPWQFRWYP